MMDFISIPTVVGIICASIYGLFELIIRRKERILMIEKMCERMDPISMDGKISFNPFRKIDLSFMSLKVGCLLAGLGLGLFFGFLLNTLVFVQLEKDPQLISSAYGSSVLLCGGLGLIIAFLIEMKYKSKKGDNK